MTCTPLSEIAFSQVREDPYTELRVVEKLAARQEQPLRVLLVASGGCTALSLLANPAVAQVDAIDLNPAQLHLVELRRQALLHLSLDEQMILIGAERIRAGEVGGAVERLLCYEQLRSRLPAATQVFWDARREQISFGVNRVGRFEQLFRQLSKRFAECGLDPFHSPAIAVQHPRWRDIFESVFERNILAQTFGNAAVDYSMERSFGEHFADVFAQAMQQTAPSQNYFLSQVWTERYVAGTDGVPVYLQAPVQTAIRRFGVERLNLHQGDLVGRMRSLAASGKFDLIQMSNISDWMPLPDLHEMLTQAVQCLNPGGALIGRRLNGDHHLAAVMANHLPVDHQLSERLRLADRSFFYREVVVGFRKGERGQV